MLWTASALRIAGIRLNIDYKDSIDEHNKKYELFVVKNYYVGLEEGIVKHLRKTKTDFYKNGLIYLVEANSKLWNNRENGVSVATDYA